MVRRRLVITVRNSSFGKVMFSQASVILSTGARAWRKGGHAWQERWPLQRTVRILLECILLLVLLWHLLDSLPAAMKLGQGNVFTGVCDSVHRGSVCLSACWDTTSPPPREQTHPPQEQTPPRADNPPGADTHPLRADTPPPSRPPGSRHPPGKQTTTCYWNAFLFATAIVIWSHRWGLSTHFAVVSTGISLALDRWPLATSFDLWGTYFGILVPWT